MDVKRNMELEELFRSKLENAEVIPDLSVRKSLMRKLAWKEFLRFHPVRFNIYYAAGIVAAGIAAAVLIFSDNKKADGIPDSTEIKREVSPDTVSMFYSPEVIRKESSERQAKPSVSPAGVEASGKKYEFKAPKADDGIALPVGDSLKKMEVSAVVTEKITGTAIRKIPVASFSASVLEGCIPLKVVFSNTSVLYDSCKWIFGDGGSSVSANAEWIYDKPGTYRVVLNVYGGGLVSTSTEVITVYPKPSAGFGIEPLNPADGSSGVKFINFSSDAVRYRWDLGDGTVSTAFEPVHKYDKSGKYNIKLTVWSKHGCADSITLINAFGGSDYFIEFPNAFIPNRDGPTGGYYSASSDASAHIFHPVASGVVEYQLRIFTRTGILIFESNDINIGWDGYNKGNLCEPGVYIWKVRGTFKNGETFVKMGDVTLLRGN